MADEQKQKSAANNTEKVMPFLDHLEELRSRLLKCLWAVFGLTIICYFFSQKIVAFLTRPYPYKLIFLAPAESFMIHIKISFFGGVLFSLPVIFYQLWQFIVPGLLEKEKKYVPTLVLVSTFFFIAGAAFCYYIVVPVGLNFLLSWQTENLLPSVTIKEYLKFVTMFMLVFGIVFEMPLLSFFLTKIGIITPKFLSSNRRYSTVIIFILAAVLTPSTDVISQLLMAGPLLLLYEVSIIVAKVIYRKKKKDESDVTG